MILLSLFYHLSESIRFVAFLVTHENLSESSNIAIAGLLIQGVAEYSVPPCVCTAVSQVHERFAVNAPSVYVI